MRHLWIEVIILENKRHFLFDNDGKTCIVCGRPLPDDFEGDMCPPCKEHDLFQQVKEYIRSNDVNEFDVADKFELPLLKVKSWIREGRIEYKDTSTDGLRSHTMQSLHCQICGKAITFGTLCPQCLKKQNSKGVGLTSPNQSDGSMHFLDSDN